MGSLGQHNFLVPANHARPPGSPSNFFCLPTFRAARGAVAAKGTCPSALGFLCFLRVSALDSSLYRSPVTSHQSRTAIPLSQTEQPTAPSPMHIIIVRSSPLIRGIARSRRLGGRHEGQAPHHPYRRRRSDRPGSRRSILDSRQSVPPHHRRKSFRRARPQSATREHEPLAAQRL